jgi:hypothetical protein
MNPLTYPIIFRYDDMTVPSGEDFVRIWNVSFRNQSRFDSIESIYPKARFHWLIDSEARLREITLEAKSREWLRPFRHIWRGVKEHYSISDGRAFTVSEFKKLLEGTRLDEEKSLTPALQDFLAEFSEDVVFTRSMLKEFMGE